MNDTYINSLFTHYCISDCLSNRENDFIYTFELERIDPIDYISPCLFMGAYNISEIKRVKEHKGPKGYIFGGKDFELLTTNNKMFDLFANSGINCYYVLSKELIHKLSAIKIKAKQIYLYDSFIRTSFTHYLISDCLNEGESDVVYSLNLSKLDFNYDYNSACIFYGAYNINEMNRIKNHKGIKGYIFVGNDFNLIITNKNMKKIFIESNIDHIMCLSKTMYDKLKEHNIDSKLINWKKNPFDSKPYLDLYNPKINFDFSTLEIKKLDNQTLDIINDNIDKFGQLVNKFKNILFICSDYPNYGGASTNCHELMKFYKLTHNVYGVFYIFDEEKNKINSDSNKFNDPDYTIIEEKKLWEFLTKLKFKPDLIILKNYTWINLKLIFKCPIIFLIPGIYYNKLDIPYNQLDTKILHNKYLNKNVINQIKNVDICFTNSYHVKQILSKYHNINTSLLYSTFIPYYKKIIKQDTDIEFLNRKYDYGVIVSNFDRNIKNIEGICNFLNTCLKTKTESKIIFIGKNSSNFVSNYALKYTSKYDKQFTLDLECINFTDNINDYYKNIKYVINLSFFESCSNVVIESIFAGCKYLSHNEIKQTIKISDDLIESQKYTILLIDVYNKNKFDVLKNIFTNFCKYATIYYLNVGIELMDNYTIPQIKILENKNIELINLEKYNNVYILDYKVPKIIQSYYEYLSQYSMMFIKYNSNDFLEKLLLNEIEKNYHESKISNNIDYSIYYRLEKIQNNILLNNIYTRKIIEYNLMDTIIMIK